jgi:hypothetical protein
MYIISWRSVKITQDNLKMSIRRDNPEWSFMNVKTHLYCH